MVRSWLIAYAALMNELLVDAVELRDAELLDSV